MYVSALYVWFTVAQVASFSIVPPGQNSASWDGINETTVKNPGNTPPVVQNIGDNQPLAFQTYGHGNQMFIAYPVDYPSAPAPRLVTLPLIASMLGLSVLPTLPGLPPLPGVTGINNQLNSILSLLNLPRIPAGDLVATPASTSPTNPIGVAVSAQTNICIMMCEVNGVQNPLEQMTLACNDRCKSSFTGAEALGICLQACNKPTRESCIGTCARLADAANRALCGPACNLLCPASVTPAPQLTDPTCCVTPPLICGSKGTRETQVTNCQASCTSSLFANAGGADDVASCQRACTNFPAESCRVDCDNRFDGELESQCFSACASLCNLATDEVSYQTGVSTRSLRPFCPASKLPVCALSVGSAALGLTRVAQQTNCLTSCTNAAFTNTPANRNVCFQACSLVPQSSCTAACAFATVEPDRVRCRAACNNICPN